MGYKVLVGISVDDPLVQTEDQARDWVLRNIPESVPLEIVDVVEEDEEDGLAPET